MTARHPDSATPDLCQFLCAAGSATFTFGMPVAEVQERSKLLTEQMSKSGLDPKKARTDVEDALRSNMRHNFHERPEHQFEMAMSLVWLTTTSEAAVEKPDARGFVLEFSDSLLSSQYPGNMTIAFASGGAPRLRGNRVGPSHRYAHYWTEPTTEAVIKICTRLRSQTFSVRASVLKSQDKGRST